MKSYVVLFSPRAELHLEGLYRYIADNSGEARADRYVGQIVTACKALSTFPARGTKRDDIRSGLRTMGYARSATIAFSVNEARVCVTIHGIFYGGQDFTSALDEEE